MTATASSTQGRLFSALSALADEIQVEKTAAAAGHEKTGAPTPPDPGGYQGASSHPTADADNSAQTATEGERSSENTADVKADQKAPAVDSTSEATPNQDEQDSVQLNIGTQQSATGEDASVEDDYKGDKDDPGTSHPAQTEDGEKYGSLTFKEAHAKFAATANEVLADLVNGFGDQLTAKQAESSDPLSRPETSAPMTPVGGSAEGEHVQPGGGGAGKPKAEKKKEAAAGTPVSPLAENLQKAADAVTKEAAAGTEPGDPMQAGYELAATLGLTKQAAHDGVQATIAQTIRDAETDAALFGSFYTTFQQKQAAVPPDAAGGEDHGNPNDASSGASEAGEGGGDAAAAGGEAPPPEAGGDAMGGAPPDMGALLGGGGDPGGAMGGAPSEEQALAELAAALEELGIPIEALIAAAGGAGGAGGDPMGDPMGGGAPPVGDPMGGGAPPLGGGAPPLGGGMEAMASAGQQKMSRGQYLTKLATEVRNFKLSGKYQMKEAGEPWQRQLRDQMKSHVRELLGL
jgi:hypothetical protein